MRITDQFREPVQRLWPVVLAALLCAGCDDERGQIRTYTVPKEQPSTADASGAAGGPAAGAAGAPVALPAGTMHWQPPDGWREVPNTSSMRFATLVAGDGDDAIEVSITEIVGQAGGIAPNINRWRGQLGLPPAGERELASSAQLVIGADGAQGLMVDLAAPAATEGSPRMLAAIFPTQSHTWFIKTTAAADAIQQHVDGFVELCQSVTFEVPPGMAAAPPTAPSMPAPGITPAGNAVPAWGPLPDGWSADAAPSAMSMASFTVTGDGQTAAVTITPLGGGQDVLANVNRWRRQVGLGPLADLGEAGPVTITVDGSPGQLVDLAGASGHTIGVVAPRGDMTWFYKLSGPDPLVASQRDAFEAFVGSIYFEAVAE